MNKEPESVTSAMKYAEESEEDEDDDDDDAESKSHHIFS